MISGKKQQQVKHKYYIFKLFLLALRVVLRQARQNFLFAMDLHRIERALLWKSDILRSKVP